MADVTFTRPDLDTFAGVDGLGLVITGQRIEVGRAVLACRVIEPDPWCRRCGGEGRVRDSVVRRLGLPHDFRTRVLGFSGCFLGVVVEVEDLLRGVVPQP